MNFKAACHRLRISPNLLKWFTKYSPKSDGRKLQQHSSGDFDAAELDAFDSYLSSGWSSKYVPAGIEIELLVEACGHCALCGDPCEKLEMAHIRRIRVEVAFYFQHPNNLIPLCGSCHNRYDDLSLKAVSLDVIVAAKERVVARKMEAIDRDVERSIAVQAAVDAVKADLASKWLALMGTAPTNVHLWQSGSIDLLTAATAGVFDGRYPVGIIDVTSPVQALETISGSIGPSGIVTQAVLDGYALEAGGEVAQAPDVWEMFDDDRTDCQLCDPGEERPPALVCYHHGYVESPRSVDLELGRCDWCNGVSIRCRKCREVRAVYEAEYGKVIECYGGCGRRFIVDSSYDPRDGEDNVIVRVAADVCKDDGVSE